MRKQEELTNPNSCLNKACDDELLFVLLSRDLAFAFALQEWIDKRIALGLNPPGDAQLTETEERIAEVLVEQAPKWDALNVRRLELAEKRSLGAANTAEADKMAAEFARLQKVYFAYLALKHPRTATTQEQLVGTTESALRAEVRRLQEANAALQLVHHEARELLGEADIEGVISRGNIEALRGLLYRASQRGATTKD